MLLHPRVCLNMKTNKNISSFSGLFFVLNPFLPMAGKSPGPFPNCDWRFNEFPNPAAHALHVTCVELMALSVPGKDVGNALLNVVLKRCNLLTDDRTVSCSLFVS